MALVVVVTSGLIAVRAARLLTDAAVSGPLYSASGLLTHDDIGWEKIFDCPKGWLPILLAAPSIPALLSKPWLPSAYWWG